MSKATSTIPPISSISAEILVLILESLLVDSAVSKKDPIVCGPEDDTVLSTTEIIRCASHVCRFWRSVCLGNPLWWSTTPIVHPWRLEEVTTLLERAQQCPLDLRISGNEGFTSRTKNVAKGFPKIFPPTLAMYTALFEIIFPILPRCRVLHLRGVFTNENRVLPFKYLEHIADAPMHALEELIFEGDLINYENHLIRRDRPLFSNTPSLKQLRLIGIDVGLFPFSSSRSFSPQSRTSSPSPPRAPSRVFYSRTLTTLHLSHAATSVRIPITQLKSTLTACPLLLTLGIYDGILDSFPVSTPMTSLMTCTVPSLKSLFILGNMLSVSELLLFLHAPKMIELVIAPTSSSDLSQMIGRDFYTDPDIYPPEELSVVFARGVKAATDRYPSLTQLTLSIVHPLGVAHSLRRASVCFPLIQRLALVIPERGYLDAFHEALSTSANTDDLELGERVMFPNLLELCLHLDLDIDLPLRLQKTPDGAHQLSSHAYIQYKRLAGWANTITAVRQARETLAGVPLNDVFVDEDTFRALKFYAKGSDESQMETEDVFDMPDVKEANIWENQRRRMLSTEVKDLFFGRPEEGL